MACLQNNSKSNITFIDTHTHYDTSPFYQLYTFILVFSQMLRHPVHAFDLIRKLSMLLVQEFLKDRSKDFLSRLDRKSLIGANSITKTF